MMRRQDEVIAQIDELNDRIETAIKEISEARKAEIAAETEAEGVSELTVSEESAAAEKGSNHVDENENLKRAA